AAAGRRLAAYRRHRRLYPLWAALHEAIPTIALTPAHSPFADRLTVRRLEFRLYRRVIEIRDGQLALRGHYDPAAEEEARRAGVAAGLSGDALRAHLEAVRIRAALAHRARHGAAAAGHTPAGPPAPGGPSEHTGLSDETAWLVRVATAFAALPPSVAAAGGEKEPARVKSVP
ncbi:MAB_1171c family putative transporter, partial [Streptomyces sp. NPDC049577]|uniref:MAB_1171c family putative transporter n=1 Tax=Streptomyces sp. NPDC049577 TaxID=3155153 RepID=UPI0034174871